MRRRILRRAGGFAKNLIVALDGSPVVSSPAVNPAVTAMANPTRGVGSIGSTRGHSAMVKSTRGHFRESTRGIGSTRGAEPQGSRKGVLQSGSHYDFAAALRHRSAGSECVSIPVADPVSQVQGTKREGRRPGFGDRRPIVELRLIIRNRRQIIVTTIV
jgi:hypothetical protein